MDFGDVWGGTDDSHVNGKSLSMREARGGGERKNKTRKEMHLPEELVGRQVMS